MDVPQGELEQLQAANKSFKKIIDSLENFKGQIKYFCENVEQTSKLLDVWTGIMAQTTLNYNISSTPEWMGGSAVI
ncbi:hypothetical protein AYI69_g1874 [Smittium culicis]|uniref:DASH complex subunit DUO1 n=1 Tax=Smittium culicis TaxID=133412 RepID=A0A1R1YP11_9FUNG|nr:hypothetical protein AYI69_g1874 [Smittium culicis]